MYKFFSKRLINVSVALAIFAGNNVWKKICVECVITRHKISIGSYEKTIRRCKYVLCSNVGMGGELSSR